MYENVCHSVQFMFNKLITDYIFQISGANFSCCSRVLLIAEVFSQLEKKIVFVR